MWLSLALKLLGIGKTLLGWAKAALRWMLSDWRHALIAILSLVAAYWYFSASKWQGRTEKALATVEQRDKTITDMKAASEAARLEQIALNNKRTQDEKDVANETDRKDAIAQGEAGRAAIVYRDRYRLRDICSTSQANSPAANPVAESGNGGSDIADMVAISEADLNACTVNSTRLQSVKAWGDDLKAAGLAVDAP